MTGLGWIAAAIACAWIAANALDLYRWRSPKARPSQEGTP